MVNLKKNKFRIVQLAVLKAANLSLSIGLGAFFYNIYFSNVKETLYTVEQASILLLLFLLVAGWTHYLINQSIYSIYQLNTIRKAILNEQPFHPLTAKDRFTHNVVIAPFVLLLMFCLFHFSQSLVHFITFFIILFVQLFVGNISSYRFNHVYLPYYLKENPRETAGENI